jgi:hypothetical protein
MREAREMEDELGEARDAKSTRISPAWRSELAEGLAVWMGIVIVGLSAAALAPVTEPHADAAGAVAAAGAQMTDARGLEAPR